MHGEANDPITPDGNDPESTIIRLPDPGGRLAKHRADSTPRTELILRSATSAKQEEWRFPEVRLGNALLAGAHGFFTLASGLRHSTTHPDPVRLRKQLIKSIGEFEQQTLQSGVSREHILAARYALCSFMDEAVLSTPWGHGSLWSTQGLLVTFHREVFGGEKFFQLLQRILLDPGANQSLLELLYACLAFGFQGRYRLVPNGQQQLDELRLSVGQALQRVQGDCERELSPTWRGITHQHHALRSGLSLGAAAAGIGVVLVGAFLWFSTTLSGLSDQQLQALHSLRSEAFLPQRELAAVPPVTEPAQSISRTLSGFLAPEISARLVTVEELPERSTVRISGDNLFALGSASMNEAYRPVLIRIAEALNALGGQVVVTGHTDDRPIRSMRFASNWDLSLVRARTVLQIMSRHMKSPDRLSFEGRGATEPVAPNDVTANRARNRRVEITLLHRGPRP